MNNGKSKELNTGFPAIDEALFSHSGKAGLITLASHPGVGKTTFLLDIAYNVAKQNKTVYFYSDNSISELEKIINKKHHSLYECSKLKIFGGFNFEANYIEKNLKVDPKVSIIIIDSIKLSTKPKTTNEIIKKKSSEFNIPVIIAFLLSKISKDWWSLDKTDLKIMANFDAIFEFCRPSYQIGDNKSKLSLTALTCLKNDEYGGGIATKILCFNEEAYSFGSEILFFDEERYSFVDSADLEAKEADKRFEYNKNDYRFIKDKLEFKYTSNKEPHFKNNYQNFDILNADNLVESIALEKAHKIYGNTLPKQVKERFDKEIALLKSNNFSVIYLACHYIAKYANSNGYHTIITGSAGSSFISFLLGITGLNPLKPHYLCKKCKSTEFYSDNIYGGYDLENKKCPVCGSYMQGDGHDMPYELFMGTDGDKLPVFKFIVSNEARSKIIDYVCALSSYVNNLTEKPPQSEYFSLSSILKWFNIRSAKYIDMLELLEKYTEIPKSHINIKGKEVFSLFKNSASLGLNGNSPKTLGIFEFGNSFIINMLEKINPSDFGELVKIFGLSHGTETWTENGELLIEKNICKITEIAASPDDIFNTLSSYGIDSHAAFEISEAVCNGKIAKEEIEESKKQLLSEFLKIHGVPQWYSESLFKIRYMENKSFAVGNTKIALALAWYKIHYPAEFYAACFSTYLKDRKYYLLCFGKKGISYANLSSLQTVFFYECFERGIEFIKSDNININLPLYLPCDNKIILNY